MVEENKNIETNKKAENHLSQNADENDLRLVDLLKFYENNGKLESLFPDIYELIDDGSKKVVASLTSKYIKEMHPDGIQLIELFAKNNGLNFIGIKNCASLENGNIGNNCILLYNEEELEEILDDNMQILEKYELPLLANEFIDRIAKNTAYYDLMPEVSELIAKCYNRKIRKVYRKNSSEYKKGLYGDFSLDDDF